MWPRLRGIPLKLVCQAESTEEKSPLSWEMKNRTGQQMPLPRADIRFGEDWTLPSI
jgi:hypothetical protein